MAGNKIYKAFLSKAMPQIKPHLSIAPSKLMNGTD
jgi:hypothetical protein